MSNSKIIQPSWQAPQNVGAVFTTRLTDPDEYLGNKAVQWLTQVHETKVFKLEGSVSTIAPEADAIYTETKNIVCGIHTADCLPVFFCDAKGKEIAVAHAGWRGLAAGVLENTAACFKADSEEIIVWFGPAIASCHFEVGEDVRDAFIEAADESLRSKTESVFQSGLAKGKWMADLYALARLRLNQLGINNISGGEYCTYCDPQKFYSYRRAKDSGRLASLIWLK